MAKQRPKTKMTGKIVIDSERCKACGLCVAVCPKGSIVISRQSNKSGYFPAEVIKADCTGCCSCAIICPEAIIRIFREESVVDIKPGKKSKSGLIKDKA